ncbi:MAG: ATP-binding protein [Thermodesulfobacteriota bacterium]
MEKGIDLNTTPRDEIADLKERLREAEELIDAIRSGSIDALVIQDHADEESIYTLQGADHTYRVLIESMDEGAVILSGEEVILYCNRRLSDLLRVPVNHLLGSEMSGFLAPGDTDSFRRLCSRAYEEKTAKTEIDLIAADGERIPTLISLCTLPVDGLESLCMVVTDLTEQKNNEAILAAYSQRLIQKNKELERRAEQLARLSSELTMTEQRERRQMSRILHDGLQQMLASARMQVETLSNKLNQADLKRSADLIADILSESIQISRSLCMDLSPPVLHDIGLEAGLQWLARSMHEKHDLKVEIDLEKAGEPAEEIKFMAFDSVRELLFNAVKHARVPQVRVSLGPEGADRLRIMVSDEGAGFDLERIDSGPNQEGGFGLFSIRERITLIGGSLEIETAPGQGSRFTLVFPRTIETGVGGATQAAVFD